MQKTPLTVYIAAKAYEESPLSILQTCMRTFGIAVRIYQCKAGTFEIAKLPRSLKANYSFEIMPTSVVYIC